MKRSSRSVSPYRGHVILIVFLVFLLAIFYFLKSMDSSDPLLEKAAGLLQEGKISYTTTVHADVDQPVYPRWRSYASSRGALDLVAEKDSVFFVTRTLLVGGNPATGNTRRYTPLYGMPSVNLTATERVGDTTIVATDGQGLAMLLEGKLTRYRFNDADRNYIADLNKFGPGVALVTRGGEVLAFDGTHFESLWRTYGSRAVSLAHSKKRSVVGTASLGVFVKTGEEIEHFPADSLAGTLVLRVIDTGKRILVATDGGLSSIGEEGAKTLAKTDSPVTDAILYKKDVYYTTMGGGFWKAGENKPLASAAPPLLRIVKSKSGLWLSGMDGIFHWKDGKLNRRFAPDLLEEPPVNRIAAIAPLPDGKLLMGGLDGKVFIHDLDGDAFLPFYDAGESGANALYVDEKAATVHVGTMKGAVRISLDGRKVESVKETIGRNVLSIGRCEACGGGIVFGTQSGLVTSSGPDSIVKELAKYAIYCMVDWNGRSFFGTLNGFVSLDESGKVDRWTTENSGLKANWVTKFLPMGESLLVATYGGGVHLMEPEGTVHPIEMDGFHQAKILPGAMIGLDDFVIAGTDGDGLLVYKKGAGWQAITKGLPSRIVLSLVFSGDEVYLGTDRGLSVLPVLDLENFFTAD